jgi:hypothetical protein
MPLQYRHIGFSLSVSCQWLFAWLTVYAGPIAAADLNVGWKVWIWFLVFNVTSIVFGEFPLTRYSDPILIILSYQVYFCCPETRGRSLEEIDLIFLKSGSPLASEAQKVLKHEHADGPSTIGTLEDGTSSEKKEVGKQKVTSESSF